MRRHGLLTNRRELRVQLVDDALGLQIPNLHARLRGGTQPISIRREAHGVDNIPSIQRVQSLAFR